MVEPGEAAMRRSAVEILDSGHLMAVSTVRADGWPQTTLVGYANDGLRLYFLIFRDSQKFANIARDDRISVAVGAVPGDIRSARAVFAAARASEVGDPAERDTAWQRLVQRHPNIAGIAPPDPRDAALMRADCLFVSVVDYTKGLGHTENFDVPESDFGRG